MAYKLPKSFVDQHFKRVPRDREGRPNANGSVKIKTGIKAEGVIKFANSTVTTLAREIVLNQESQ